MRLVCISDTHEFHDQVQIPDGDVLIHAGDITMQGHPGKVAKFLAWFGEQPHKNKIFIAGNHDWIFETKPEIARQMVAQWNITYLEDSGCEIDGIKFWGSPVQPEFQSWAFNRKRGPEIKRHWNLIPEDTDVLITHGPPMGFLDQCVYNNTDYGHVGCEELLEAIKRVNPRYHIFGHIHGGGGRTEIRRSWKTTFINASIVNEAYQVQNKPIVVEI